MLFNKTHAVGPEDNGPKTKQELLEAKQRESETSIRVAALEAEVEQSRVTKQEMQMLLEDTAQRLQVSCQKSSSLCLLWMLQPSLELVHFMPDLHTMILVHDLIHMGLLSRHTKARLRQSKHR